MTERASAQRVAHYIADEQCSSLRFFRAAEVVSPYGCYGSSGAPPPTVYKKAVSGETAFCFVYKPAVSFMYLRAFTAYSNGFAFAGSCSASTTTQPS